MPESNKIASVVVDEVSKTFRINKEGSEVSGFWRRDLKSVEAVKPMTFAAYEGEAVGILGQNGSGKSTLLSMIAGNEAPTTGKIYVSARPSLLSVSAALQPHLSGLQNVQLGLLAKGLSPEEVEELCHPVAEWAALGDAIHRPISTYSSGMAARLRFSIATAVRPEILLVDEALSTGDSTFNSRAQDRMNEFLNGTSTVFIVSHAPATILAHCTRALWIHKGELITDLPAKMAVKWYTRWSRFKAKGKEDDAADLIKMLKKFYKKQRIEFTTPPQN